MTTTEIQEKLAGVLLELKTTTCAGQPQIKDVVTDSLDLIKFVVKLEETFNIFIDERYLADPRMSEIDYVVEVIEKCL